MRRVIERVVVENDVHFLCLPGQRAGASCDLFDFVVAVIVIETRCHRFAGRVGARIAAVQTQIGQLGLVISFKSGGMIVKCFSAGVSTRTNAVECARRKSSVAFSCSPSAQFRFRSSIAIRYSPSAPNKSSSSLSLCPFGEKAGDNCKRQRAQFAGAAQDFARAPKLFDHRSLDFGR